ncbi:MAG: N-acetyltransferase family protein [Caldilineaceae bacterium]
MIRLVDEADAQAICHIYNYYVCNTFVTFEEEPVAPDEMAQRIRATVPIFPWVVLENAGEIAGYAYASRWKTRSAYRYAAELTIYLAPTATGQGFGSRLYEHLIADLRDRSLHCLIGGVALPNAASVALHEKFGFVKVAHFKQVGWKFNQRIDVAYWELIF